MKNFALLATAAAIAISPVNVEAAWLEAQSEHFVIYADDSEQDITKLGQQLELYHSAMSFVEGRSIDDPSPSNRVIIFVVGDQKDLRELAGGNNRFLAGFYVPRAGSSKAFVQDIGTIKSYPSQSVQILLHEYAHHFLISTNRIAMPRWMSEGAAEFYSSVKFDGDDKISIGGPAHHRAYELWSAQDVSIEELFDAELYAKNRGNRYDAFYGRSWLLYHYLFYSEERQGQKEQYWVRVANGMAPIEAATQAFGDLSALDRELDAYLRMRRMSTINLDSRHVSKSPVSVRKVSEGAAAMMGVRIQSQRGVDREEASALVVESRKIAARFPDDPAVLEILAETEYDAGNNQEAIAAADRAIALNPRLVNPYIQKGYALYRMAEDADTPEAWDAAREPFAALSALEPDHPIPLIYFYRIAVQRDGRPDAQARKGLERAADLAPFDLGLALETAVMLGQEGRNLEAQRRILPVAYSPHGGSQAAYARTILAALRSTPEGTPFTVPIRVDLPDIGQEDGWLGLFTYAPTRVPSRLP